MFQIQQFCSPTLNYPQSSPQLSRPEASYFTRLVFILSLPSGKAPLALDKHVQASLISASVSCTADLIQRLQGESRSPVTPFSDKQEQTGIRTEAAPSPAGVAPVKGKVGTRVHAQAAPAVPAWPKAQAAISDIHHPPQNHHPTMTLHSDQPWSCPGWEQTDCSSHFWSRTSNNICCRQEVFLTDISDKWSEGKNKVEMLRMKVLDILIKMGFDEYNHYL